MNLTLNISNWYRLCFYGEKGSTTRNLITDAIDVYGKTKIAGEIMLKIKLLLDQVLLVQSMAEVSLY